MAALRYLAGRSIAIRLATSALFWSFLILLVAGLILSALYRDTTERAFDTRLLVHATDLASDLVSQGNPDQRELGTLGDPRFDLPLSGWYWQVGQPDARPRDIRSSRSLFGAQLPSARRAGRRQPLRRDTQGLPTRSGGPRCCASSSATSTSARTVATSCASPARRTRSTARCAASSSPLPSPSRFSASRSARPPSCRSASASAR